MIQSGHSRTFFSKLGISFNKAQIIQDRNSQCLYSWFAFWYSEAGLNVTCANKAWWFAYSIIHRETSNLITNYSVKEKEKRIIQPLKWLVWQHHIQYCEYCEYCECYIGPKSWYFSSTMQCSDLKKKIPNSGQKTKLDIIVFITQVHLAWCSETNVVLLERLVITTDTCVKIQQASLHFWQQIYSIKHTIQ